MDSEHGHAGNGRPLDPRGIDRPDRLLLTYYFVVSLLTGPLCVIAFPPLFFKYHTLRYKFDDTGVSMSWGVLFRREIHLAYRRIQDIHLTRGIVQRWLGLATLAIQTASGSSTAEMSIEGILEPEKLRDFLYSKMRGGHGEEPDQTADVPTTGHDDEALALLHEIRDLLREAAAGQGDPS